MSRAFYIQNSEVKHGFDAIYSCCFILFAVKSASILAHSSTSWSGNGTEIPSEYEVCISKNEITGLSLSSELKSAYMNSSQSI